MTRNPTRYRRFGWLLLFVVLSSGLLAPTEARAQTSGVSFTVDYGSVERGVATHHRALVGDITLTYQDGDSASGGSEALKIDYGVPIYDAFVSGTGAYSSIGFSSYTWQGSVLLVDLPSCGINSEGCFGTIQIRFVRVDLAATNASQLQPTVSILASSGYSIAGDEPMPVVDSILPGLTSQGIAGTSALVLDDGSVPDPTWSLRISENFVDAFGRAFTPFLRVEFIGIPSGVTLHTEGGGPPLLFENGNPVTELFFEYGWVDSAENSDWLEYENCECGGPFSPSAISTIEISGTISFDDYDAVLPLPEGEIRARVTLAWDDDNCPFCEGDAWFETDLVPSGGIVVAEILPADSTVSVQSTSNASEDGPVPGSFVLSRTGNISTPLFVEYSIGGTATNGADYVHIPAFAEFPAGEDRIVITVSPLPDTLADPGETVTLRLRDTGLYKIGTVSATMVIADGPELSLVTLSATDPIAVEGSEDHGLWKFERTGSTDSPLTVSYTIDGTATSGVDYAIPTTVTIPEGASSSALVLEALADGIGEGDETVSLTLVGGVGYAVGSPSTGTVTIREEPLPVITLRARDSQAVEGTGDTGRWIFQRTGSTADALNVEYSISGSAQQGSDYVIGTSVTIPAGQSTVDLILEATADGIDEGEETATLTLASLSSYAIGTPSSATIVIRDTVVIDLDLSGDDSGDGADSIELSLAVGSPPSSELVGRMRFEFVPDPQNAAGRDGASFVWFEPNGSPTAEFRIPPGATSPLESVSIRVGTVAGTLTVFAETLSGELLDRHEIRVRPAAPRIDSLRVERSGSQLNIYVIGFSTTVEVTTASFTFNGPNVQQFPSISVGARFRQWFDDPASQQFGSMFQYIQEVNVTSGDPGSVASVTVTLQNSQGTSNARTAPVE